MTQNQINLFVKLRKRLSVRGIKNIPTTLKVKSFDSQRSFMLVKVLSEEIKNMDSWENSLSFRQACFDRYGPDFSIFKKVEEEIKNVVEYVKVQ